MGANKRCNPKVNRLTYTNKQNIIYDRICVMAAVKGFASFILLSRRVEYFFLFFFKLLMCINNMLTFCLFVCAGCHCVIWSWLSKWIALLGLQRKSLSDIKCFASHFRVSKKYGLILCSLLIKGNKANYDLCWLYNSYKDHQNPSCENVICRHQCLHTPLSFLLTWVHTVFDMMEARKETTQIRLAIVVCVMQTY